jgi:hypothetical protein
VNEQLAARVAAIEEGQRAIQNGWPFFMAEVQAQIDQLTAELVEANNDETRGRIKALVSILNLPESLEIERQALAAALAEEAAA